jgi:hypothetical protein
LIAHPRPECERSTIIELGVKLTFDAQENVALGAPVIGPIAWRVLDHSNADTAEMLRSPVGKPALAFMLSVFDSRPVRGSERDA